MSFALHEAPSDPAEVVARVAAARRELLLRVHRRRLRFEDLEDCYSQATLELLVRSRRSPFADEQHAENALEQKFLSRIADRRRALAGRSGIEAAIANSVPVDGEGRDHQEIEDRVAGVERQVMVHAEVRRLREVIADLTLDQRLVLHGQVNLDLNAERFCQRYGWSTEKFRKVAQRARWRLRTLVDEYQAGERCRRLEPDLIAYAAKAGSEEQHARARLHLSNCAPCTRYVAQLGRVEREVAAVLPPVACSGALIARVAAHLTPLKRLLIALRHPASEAGGTGVAGIAGGSSVGLASVKAGVLALCIAGAAGGYAICQHAPAGVLLRTATQAVNHHHHHHGAAAAAPDSAPVMRPPQVETARIAQPRGRHARQRALLAQIRREFGRHHAIAAAAAPVPAHLPAQTPATVAQERTEFGFER